jgi:hypothetical protein
LDQINVEKNEIKLSKNLSSTLDITNIIFQKKNIEFQISNTISRFEKQYFIYENDDNTILSIDGKISNLKTQLYNLSTDILKLKINNSYISKKLYNFYCDLLLLDKKLKICDNLLTISLRSDTVSYLNYFEFNNNILKSFFNESKYIKFKENELHYKIFDESFDYTKKNIFNLFLEEKDDLISVFFFFTIRV